MTPENHEHDVSRKGMRWVYRTLRWLDSRERQGDVEMPPLPEGLRGRGYARQLIRWINALKSNPDAALEATTVRALIEAFREHGGPIPARLAAQGVLTGDPELWRIILLSQTDPFEQVWEALLARSRTYSSCIEAYVEWVLASWTSGLRARRQFMTMLEGPDTPLLARGAASRLEHALNAWEKQAALLPLQDFHQRLTGPPRQRMDSIASELPALADPLEATTSSAEIPAIAERPDRPAPRKTLLEPLPVPAKPPVAPREHPAPRPPARIALLAGVTLLATVLTLAPGDGNEADVDPEVATAADAAERTAVREERLPETETTSVTRTASMFSSRGGAARSASPEPGDEIDLYPGIVTFINGRPVMRSGRHHCVVEEGAVPDGSSSPLRARVIRREGDLIHVALL